jgi:hypothetical protein
VEFPIQKTNRCNIFFFGMETSGGLSKEATKICTTLLARLSGGSPPTDGLKTTDCMKLKATLKRIREDLYE